MTTRRVPCRYCDGTGHKYGPSYIANTQAAIVRIEEALALDDKERLQAAVGAPCPRAKVVQESW